MLNVKPKCTKCVRFLFRSFEFCIEVLDLMDDVVNLQTTVFHQMDRAHENSMTATGQCKLYPLVLTIQDSCQIYDYIVKILFKLHKGKALTNDPVLFVILTLTSVCLKLC